MFQIENLEDLLKEKDNQVDLAKSKLSQVKNVTNLNNKQNRTQHNNSSEFNLV